MIRGLLHSLLSASNFGRNLREISLLTEEPEIGAIQKSLLRSNTVNAGELLTGSSYGLYQCKQEISISKP
jgi:hypothetical protein